MLRYISGGLRVHGNCQLAWVQCSKPRDCGFRVSWACRASSIGFEQ